MAKHCGNCANHSKETNQFSNECGKCVIAVLENGERTAPSRWKAKPLTNADCIRALDDEELAEFLWTLTLEDIATARAEGDTKYLSRNKLIEWLKQSVTEDLRGDNDVKKT